MCPKIVVDIGIPKTHIIIWETTNEKMKAAFCEWYLLFGHPKTAKSLYRKYECAIIGRYFAYTAKNLTNM